MLDSQEAGEVRDSQGVGEVREAGGVREVREAGERTSKRLKGGKTPQSKKYTEEDLWKEATTEARVVKRGGLMCERQYRKYFPNNQEE